MTAPSDPSSSAATADDTADCARRRSILAAANALLDEEGLEGLTLRAMLKRTGLARRAFYERFAGKDDLVLAVFAETLKDAATFFAEIAAGIADPLDQLRAIVFGLVIGSQPHVGAIGPRRVSAMVREHMRLAQSRPADLDEALRPLLALIADRIRAGIAAGALRDCDPARQAALIYNLVSSTLHTELLIEEGGDPAPARRQRLAEDIWAFCRQGIAA